MESLVVHPVCETESIDPSFSHSSLSLFTSESCGSLMKSLNNINGLHIYIACLHFILRKDINVYFYLFLFFFLYWGRDVVLKSGVYFRFIIIFFFLSGKDLNRDFT